MRLGGRLLRSKTRSVRGSDRQGESLTYEVICPRAARLSGVEAAAELLERDCCRVLRGPVRRHFERDLIPDPPIPLQAVAGAVGEEADELLARRGGIPRARHRQ